MSFHQDKDIKAVRKPHRCQQCPQQIDAGRPAVYSTGVYYGDFYHGWEHPECRAASIEYAKLNNLYGEEWPWFHDIMDGDLYAWLLSKHPKAAEKFSSWAHHWMEPA